MRFLSFLLFVVLPLSGVAQVALLDKVSDFIADKQFQKAENAIHIAEKNVATANDARTYYLKAFVYKELFLQEKTGGDKNLLRNNVISSLAKCKQLDHDGAFKQPIRQLHDFVSASIYNDGTESYNNEKYKEAISYFRKFLTLSETNNNYWLDANYFIGSSYYVLENLDSAELFLKDVKDRNYDQPSVYADLTYLYLKRENKKSAMQVVNEGLTRYADFFDLQIAELNVLAKFQSYDTLEQRLEIFLSKYTDNIEVLLLAGTTYEKKKDGEAHYKYFSKAEAVYKKVLELDHKNYDANYNLGVLYYNEAVDIVNKSSLETSIDELGKILEKSTQLFEKALPHLLNIYDSALPNLKLLQALQAIYYNLNMKTELSDVTEKIKSLNK